MGARARPLTHRAIRSALVVALGVVAAGVWAGLVATRPAPALHGDAVWPARSHPAPPVSLVDQDGHRSSLRAAHGRVVLLTFLDSVCTKDCPIIGRQLRDVGRALGRSARPELFVVSVDPADTPRTARSFVAKAGLGTWRWHWLMGSRPELAAAWRAYGITVLPQQGDIAHSTVLYLLDRKGDQRAGYLLPLPVADVASDVRTVSAARRWWPW